MKINRSKIGYICIFAAVLISVLVSMYGIVNCKSIITSPAGLIIMIVSVIIILLDIIWIVYALKTSKNK